MSYSLDNDIESEDNNQARIQSLTGSFVCCPQCGTRNIFELGKDKQELTYFCKRCSSKLNDFWQSYRQGNMDIDYCRNCGQPTFKAFKYCISCGYNKYDYTTYEIPVTRITVKKKPRESLFIYKKPTGLLDCLIGTYGFRVNRNHPKAGMVIAILITISFILLAAAIAIFVIFMTGWG